MVIKVTYFKLVINETLYVMEFFCVQLNTLAKTYKLATRMGLLITNVGLNFSQ